MGERTITILLGAMLYAIGAIAVNLFIEPVHRLFLIPPAAELLVMTLGIFFLSAFFWGRFSYFLLLVAGLWLGGLFPQHPLYVILGGVPLLIALRGGSLMGENALLDLRGQGNLFDEKKKYIALACLAGVLSIAIGLAAPQIPADAAIAQAQGLLRAMGIA